MQETQRGYKGKTIKRIIANKVDKWLESIDDEPLRNDLRKGVIVTGGCIASMLLGEEVNDFDIYLRTRDLTYRTACYYVDKFNAQHNKKGIDTPISVVEGVDGKIELSVKSSGIAREKQDEVYKYFESHPDADGIDFVQQVTADTGDIQDTHDDIEITLRQMPEEKKYRPVFLTSNAITLSDKVQLVLRFYGGPAEIHDNYDFAHCMNYWTSWDRHLVLRPEALEALLCRELKYVGSKYPVCSLIRVRKFLARGWQINAGQMMKMIFQVSKLVLEDYTVLRDQLTGVDTAYFSQLLERLKEKDPEKVNGDYLIGIIDRLFA